MNNEFSLSAAREARIDRAIDRAVREMMQIDPPPGLRRRVLARLNDSSERRGHLMPRLAFTAVALIVLTVSVTLMRDRIEPPAPPKPPTIAAIAPLPVPEPQEVPTRPTQPKITREPIRMPRITNVFGSRRDNVAATGVDSNRYVPRTILPESLVPLTIVPLSARPIVIEPLVLPPLSKGGQ